MCGTSTSVTLPAIDRVGSTVSLGLTSSHPVAAIIKRASTPPSYGRSQRHCQPRSIAGKSPGTATARQGGGDTTVLEQAEVLTGELGMPSKGAIGTYPSQRANLNRMTKVLDFVKRWWDSEDCTQYQV